MTEVGRGWVGLLPSADLTACWYDRPDWERGFMGGGEGGIEVWLAEGSRAGQAGGAGAWHLSAAARDSRHHQCQRSLWRGQQVAQSFRLFRSLPCAGRHGTRQFINLFPPFPHCNPPPSPRVAPYPYWSPWNSHFTQRNVDHIRLAR